MGLVHRHVGGWPFFGWPRNRQQLFDIEGGQEWTLDGGNSTKVTPWLCEQSYRDPDKDVEITSEDGTRRIRAHHEEKTEHKQKRRYRSEFRYGEFEREIAVPIGAAAKDVKATYKDGILKVRVPCSEGTDRRRPRFPSLGSGSSFGLRRGSTCLGGSSGCEALWSAHPPAVANAMSRALETGGRT